MSLDKMDRVDVIKVEENQFLFDKMYELGFPKYYKSNGFHYDFKGTMGENTFYNFMENGFINALDENKDLDKKDFLLKVYDEIAKDYSDFLFNGKNQGLPVKEYLSKLKSYVVFEAFLMTYLSYERALSFELKKMLDENLGRRAEALKTIYGMEGCRNKISVLNVFSQYDMNNKEEVLFKYLTVEKNLLNETVFRLDNTENLDDVFWRYISKSKFLIDVNEDTINSVNKYRGFEKYPYPEQIFKIDIVGDDLVCYGKQNYLNFNLQVTMNMKDISLHIINLVRQNLNQDEPVILLDKNDEGDEFLKIKIKNGCVDETKELANLLLETFITVRVDFINDLKATNKAVEMVKNVERELILLDKFKQKDVKSDIYSKKKI